VRTFFDFIDRLSASEGAERAALEAEIWERFGVERTLLALDMSQFSLSVRRSGILPYLALIRRMHLLTRPIVESNGGAVVKYEADNMLATFHAPVDAVRAALDINRAIAGGGEKFTVAIGIDHGRFIVIDDADCWGDTVNVACKLGEDVARAGEVLLTDAAAKALGDAFALREQRVSVSGIEIHVHAVDLSSGR